jgi:hypothetical protein
MTNKLIDIRKNFEIEARMWERDRREGRLREIVRKAGELKNWMRVPWVYTGHDLHDSHYEYDDWDGRFFTRTDSDDGSCEIKEYPSYQYMENWILLNNQGTRIKTTTYNR